MFSAIRTRLTPRSTRAQLTLWYLLLPAGALAAFAVFVFVARARTLYSELDAQLELRAQQLLGEVRPALLELDVVEALSGDRRLTENAIAVRERSGAILFRSPAFPVLGGVAEATAAGAARNGNALATVEDRFGQQVRLATIVVDRTGAAPVAIQVAAPTEPVRHILNQFALILLLLFVTVLSVASYGASFIARRALRPVDAIVERVRAIQASWLGERLDLSTGSEELDRLVETLNNMLDRLDASMRSAQRFAADASHELQTPIAAMRAAVDLCLTGEQSPTEQRVMASDLLVEIDRLSTLVRDLRLLALADAGHLVDRVEPIDLTAVVSECCDIARAIAEPNGIVVSVDILANVVVNGSTLHLRRALLNLVHNAVRYSPEGSTVQITVGRVDEEAALVIVDEGCGIPPADLPHIFGRFYRADPARARATGGTGLGLAIADQIIRSHGGRIEASSVVDQGSTFAVFLPLTPASDLSPDRSAHTVNAR
jgi:heavy metal sensor kinase